MLMSIIFVSTILAQGTATEGQGPKTEFLFQSFLGNQSELLTAGDATIISDGLLRLTDQKPNIIGTTFYHKPVRLLETSSDSTKTRVCSFSTSIVFAIISSSSSNGGYGFTLTLSPTPNRTGAEPGHYLGFLNKETNGKASSGVFALEFDTAQGLIDGNDRTGNHIGLNVNSLISIVQEPVAYYDNVYPDRKEDFTLQSGDPIRAYLDYDALTKTVNVTVYPANLKYRPSRPLISKRFPKLSQIIQEEMYVGFTAATGENKSSAHYVMGWSFSSGGEHPVAPELKLSELPLPPPNKEKKRGYNAQSMALTVALSAVTLILLALMIIFVIYKKRLKQGEILEDWEVNHPHRLRYKDLYSATNGFKADRIIGAGGFGTVFRGSITTSSPEQIAVKKITPNSMQGIREFIAEIESLGRLSHKNLVNLRGWCKHKSELLLAYDYIPHGSLDSLLYTVPRRIGAALSWNVRLKIAKGIASGLMYLHEECEQIVVHRDVKPSNVLIEDDMNPRLGDFGLARLYERGSQSHTTVVVGTVGYMAPEITRSGNSSCASDVFAFGVLILEIVCGRKPTDSGSFFIADWVMQLHASGAGEILRAVDPRLNHCYDVGEARLALAVGLLCCRHRPASRPSMRMVIQYLNGDEHLPGTIVDDWAEAGLQ